MRYGAKAILQAESMFTLASSVGVAAALAVASPRLATAHAAESQASGSGQAAQPVQRAERKAAFRADIAEQARRNSDYRRVLFTGPKMQVVLMSIPAGEDIGEETHQRVEQILVCVSGSGKTVVNGVASPFQPGDLVMITPGTRHDFINTGTGPLKLYTIYSPPSHLGGRVQATKSAAERDAADIDFGRHAG